MHPQPSFPHTLHKNRMKIPYVSLLSVIIGDYRRS